MEIIDNISYTKQLRSFPNRFPEPSWVWDPALLGATRGRNTRISFNRYERPISIHTTFPLAENISRKGMWYSMESSDNFIKNRIEYYLIGSDPLV